MVPDHESCVARPLSSFYIGMGKKGFGTPTIVNAVLASTLVGVSDE